MEGEAYGLGDLMHPVGVGEVVDQAVQAVEECQAFLDETFHGVENQVAASCQAEAYLVETTTTRNAVSNFII